MGTMGTNSRWLHLHVSFLKWSSGTRVLHMAFFPHPSRMSQSWIVLGTKPPGYQRLPEILTAIFSLLSQGSVHWGRNSFFPPFLSICSSLVLETGQFSHLWIVMFCSRTGRSNEFVFNSHTAPTLITAPKGIIPKVWC
jgi:hypothetical protein